jgi:pilus assembly protein CpaC
MVCTVAAVAGGPASSQGPAEPAWTLTDSNHRSHIVIPPLTRFPITRKITIGVDKSLLIELPVDLKDVLVSNPNILDAVVQSSRQVYLLAKDIGDANAFFIGPEGRKLVFLEVSVARDLTPLTDALTRLLPGSRVKAESIGENIVLTGSVINPVDANRAGEIASRYAKKKDAVVNMLAVAAKEQVLLKVQVAEMQRSILRQFGINVGALINSGNFSTAILTQNSLPVTGASLGTLPLPGIDPATAALGLTNQSITGQYMNSGVDTIFNSGKTQLAAVLRALERDGLIRTLAEPNLTAISGEQAKFLAGGEFPVPVSNKDGELSVSWKEFGVGLSFKPVVMSEGRISLVVKAEVSDLSPEAAVTTGGISIPGLKVRRAETTLELPSGGTLAMAGLLSDETRQAVDGVPWAKTIPVLGALFRSNDYLRKESELVILVTPYLATHAPKSEFARPDGGYAPSSTLQELFLGHINRIYGPNARPPKGHYQGEFGFIIDYPDPGVKG